jgi:hypothetical protein
MYVFMIFALHYEYQELEGGERETEREREREGEREIERES